MITLTPNELYDSFQIKAEKNGLNDNISISPDRFVNIFNEEQVRFVENIYEKNNDDIRYIQNLLVDDKKLKEKRKHLDHVDLELPSDYMLFSNIYALASKENCKNKKIDLYPLKDKERNIVLQNYELRPSFPHRESVYTLGNNKVKIYTDKTFTVESAYLSYYKYPTMLKLVDINDPELGLDNSIRIDFDKKALDRIISQAVANFDINNSNERFQINQQKANIKN